MLGNKYGKTLPFLQCTQGDNSVIPSADETVLLADAVVVAGSFEADLGVKELSMLVGVAPLHAGVLDLSY